MKTLGWHAQLWATCETITAAAPVLLGQSIPLVLDHMGRFDVGRGAHDAAFRALLRLIEEDSVWIKLTPARNSRHSPDYEDVRPFHDALARESQPPALGQRLALPARGRGDAPELGHLLDLLDDWCGDEPLRRKILTENPAQLYRL